MLLTSVGLFDGLVEGDALGRFVGEVVGLLEGSCLVCVHKSKRYGTM